MTLDSMQTRPLLRALLVLALSLWATFAVAQAPVADKEYKLIKPAQTPQGKKIEVIEFFSYACPHCAEFEAPLRAWLKNKPADVEFKAVPVIFRETWLPLAKLHFTLESMGQLERLHAKVFHAMHGEGIDLSDEGKLNAWLAKQGVDMVKFKQIYGSFGIDPKMETYKKMARDHQVQFTPVIAINGKYITGPSMAVGPNGQVSLPRFFQIVDALIGQERPAAGAAPGKDAAPKKNAAPKKDVKPRKDTAPAKPKPERAQSDKPA